MIVIVHAQHCPAWLYENGNDYTTPARREIFGERESDSWQDNVTVDQLVKLYNIYPCPTIKRAIVLMLSGRGVRCLVSNNAYKLNKNRREFADTR